MISRLRVTSENSFASHASVISFFNDGRNSPRTVEQFHTFSHRIHKCLCTVSKFYKNISAIYATFGKETTRENKAWMGGKTI
jgi:hypothetical protein